MSKKLAAGADRVILDVKVGRGAFMKSLDQARELARTMVRIGQGADVTTVAALTAMDEPLGSTVGNALEVREACALLTGNGPIDRRFRDLCLTLAGRALVLSGKAEDLPSGVALAESTLDSGKAAEKFAHIIEAQGGDPAVVHDSDRLRVSRVVKRVRSDSAGFVTGIDAEAVGRLGVWLGGGREQKEDQIDHSVGITLLKKTGDSLNIGDVFADLSLREETQAGMAANRLREAITIAAEASAPIPVIYEFIES
jgi:thymidine phosphorylase